MRNILCNKNTLTPQTNIDVNVRSAFFNGDIIISTREIPQEIQYIVDNVLYDYGDHASWKLREISHQDSSWINSRHGLKLNQPGHTILSNEDIRNDASKIRPYDHLWDMYYDEFEDEKTALCNVRIAMH